jgi:integrase
MSFIDNLKQKLLDKKLSPSSINLYIRNLEKMNDNEQFKNFNFLKKPEDVSTKLDKYKNNTKRSYFISIVSALSTEPKHKKLYDKYYKMMMDINSTIKQTPTEEKSEAQKENWIEWDEVKEKYNNLLEEVKKLPKKLKNESQYNILLNFVVLSLYVLIPPRRNSDYQKMNAIKGINITEKTRNYYDVDENTFTFNIYKTSTTHGTQIEEIPTELKDVLHLYLKHHPLVKGKKYDVPFLVYFNGTPLDKINSITYLLNKIFSRKIGSSMLRHIYLSYKYGNITDEMKKDADFMAHNTQTQKDYIKS